MYIEGLQPENLMLVFQCHHGFLADGHLPQVSCESVNKCDNEVILGDVLRYPCIYIMTEENLSLVTV